MSSFHPSMFAQRITWHHSTHIHLALTIIFIIIKVIYIWACLYALLLQHHDDDEDDDDDDDSIDEYSVVDSSDDEALNYDFDHLW